MKDLLKGNLEIIWVEAQRRLQRGCRIWIGGGQGGRDSGLQLRNDHGFQWGNHKPWFRTQSWETWVLALPDLLTKFYGSVLASI